MNFKALFKSFLLRKFTSALLLVQMMITLGLLVNAVILTQDNLEKLSAKSGMANENLLIVQLRATSGDFNNNQYFASVREQDMAAIATLPGVKYAVPINQLPYQRGGWNADFYDRDNPEIVQNNKELSYVSMHLTSYEIAQALGVTLIAGRDLTAADKDLSGEQTNILISHSLAKALYGEEYGENAAQAAIGQLANQGTIVGVVSDTRIRPDNSMDNQYAWYLPTPLKTSNFGEHYLIHADPEAIPTIRAQIKQTLLSVHPERDITDVYTMQERIAQYYSFDSGLANLFVMLCGLMIIVTAISSFAHAQFHVSKQKKLIGIRRALGATKADVIQYVLAENGLMVVLGCLFGMITMVGFNIVLIQHLDISKPSVAVYLLSCSVIFISSFIAAWLPAWKTSKIAPVVATRTV